MPDRDPPIHFSQRFQRAYGKSSAVLQSLIQGTVHDFVALFRSQPSLVLHEYARLAHLDEAVLEIDVAGARRLLASLDDGLLTLLDVGGKDIVTNYTKGMLYRDLLTQRDAPPQSGPR